jgi:phosphoribosyl-AMP cyclohydrolase / phosphoribosyl-ATP pyrophosphohydrolase
MIYPSIDLLDGKAVQLVNGKTKELELNNPIELAEQFSVTSIIHLIDLNAAFSKGNNFNLIKQICSFANLRVGGGIRSVDYAKELIGCGASKIIIGTKANKEFLQELIKVIPKEKIIIAVDVNKGFVSVEGWTKKTSIKPTELIKELENYCSEFIITCIEKEGKMQGINWNLINEIRESTENKLTVAGGITSVQEINKLNSMKIDSVLGMSLYKNKLNLTELFINQLKFQNNLIPTIVQDFNSKNVLMLAYSNKDSLKKAINSRKGIYFSRSRNKIWVKGETSGNTQKLIKVKADCDKDTLLFSVKQKGVACHKGNYSCFGSKSIDVTFLNELMQVLKQRKNSNSNKSYTKKLFENPELLKSKIQEEALEVIEAINLEKKDLIWEISDLLYFLMVTMQAKEISIKEIMQELKRRRK